MALKRAFGGLAASQLALMARVGGFLVAGFQWTKRVYLSLLVVLQRETRSNSMLGGSQHLLGDSCTSNSRLSRSLTEMRGDVSPQSCVVFKSLLATITSKSQLNPGVSFPLSSSGEDG